MFLSVLQVLTPLLRKLALFVVMATSGMVRLARNSALKANFSTLLPINVNAQLDCIGLEKFVFLATVANNSEMTLKLVSVLQEQDGMAMDAQKQTLAQTVKNGMCLLSPVNAQLEPPGTALSALSLITVEVDNISTISLSVYAQLIHSLRMESVRQLAAQEDKSGMDNLVHVKLGITGMVACAYFVSTVKCGIQGPELADVRKVIDGMEISVRNSSHVPVVEFLIKTMSSACALMGISGMELSVWSSLTAVVERNGMRKHSSAIALKDSNGMEECVFFALLEKPGTPLQKPANALQVLNGTINFVL